MASSAGGTTTRMEDSITAKAGEVSLRRINAAGPSDGAKKTVDAGRPVPPSAADALWVTQKWLVGSRQKLISGLRKPITDRGCREACSTELAQSLEIDTATAVDLVIFVSRRL
jgi:hypothetical protein